MQARILVVEDNPSHRALLKEICESFDFEVDLRENAEEALDAVMMFNQYAVIIVDVGLPGMSGLECAASVRTFEQRKNITRTPIIALSAIDELNMTAVSSSGLMTSLPNHSIRKGLEKFFSVGPIDHRIRI